MAKFVVLHVRTQHIATTIEAENWDDAMSQYRDYADEDFDKVDRRFDEAYDVYDTYCDEYENDGDLERMARTESLREILTIEEARRRE